MSKKKDPNQSPPSEANSAKEEEEIEVRELELEDLAQVFALGERVFTPDRWPNLYRTWDEYEVVDFFSSDGDTCFVASDKGQIVGFVLGSLIEKRRSSWAYGYLVWIAVDPDIKRKGVGSLLVEHLFERFVELGARMSIVDTESTNTNALAFFRKQGYGHEQSHVYLTLNLTKRPDYKRIRERSGLATQPSPRRRPRKAPGSSERTIFPPIGAAPRTPGSQ
jgi:ribosomal protein S18 acetylase RimI-like enzyme